MKSEKRDDSKEQQVVAEVRREVPQADKPSGEAAGAKMRRSETDIYFDEVFFQRTWSRLLVAESPLDLDLLKGNPQETASVLWNSLVPSLDRYAEKFNLPQKEQVQTDEQFFRVIVDKMWQLNQENGENWDCWPSVAVEDGAANCALGSQILARHLTKIGYRVEFGMPGPLSHAVVVVEDEAGAKYYLDQANGVTAKISSEQEVDGVKAYRLETDDERIPFRLIPAFPIEQSVAPTVWNLGALAHKALKEGADPYLLVLMKKLGVEPRINYDRWGKEHILPEALTLLDNPVWQKEQKESSKRIESGKIN